MSDLLERHFYIRSADILARMVAFLQANWEAMAKADRPLVIHITEYNATRTVDMNRRYWAILQDISEQAWFSGKRYGKEVWHEAMRRRFLPLVDGPDGSYPTSTSSLTIKQFADYSDRVETFAITELGCEL